MSTEVIGSNDEKLEPMASVSARSNSVSFSLPALPGSLNDLYEINRPDSGLPRKRLRGEWALWVSRMTPLVPAFEIAPSSVLRVDRTYFLPWFYSNKRWRKVDVINMDALLFNLVTRKIGVDDSRVKCGWLDSHDSQNPRVEITMTEVSEDQWRQHSERIV